MSLRPCRECGQRVSTEASTCPSCGVPNPASAAGCGCRSLLLLAVFGLIAFGIGVGVRLWEGPRPPDPGAGAEPPDTEAEAAARGPAPVPSTFPALRVGLTRSEGSIHLTNADTFDWTACKIDLNAGSFPGGYSTDVQRIAAGARVSTPLETFVRGDAGEPFDPSQRVVSVDVHCDTPSGRAHHNGVFR